MWSRTGSRRRIGARTCSSAAAIVGGRLRTVSVPLAVAFRSPLPVSTTESDGIIPEGPPKYQSRTRLCRHAIPALSREGAPRLSAVTPSFALGGQHDVRARLRIRR